MAVENSNLHVVFDEQWVIAAEGEGRLHVGMEFTIAIATATALATERKALLYIHDKDGWIAERMDCSAESTPTVPMAQPRKNSEPLPRKVPNLPRDAGLEACASG